MKITYLSQNEIRSGYQVIFWYTFSMENVVRQEDFNLIEFVRSEYFKEHVKPEIVKQGQSKTYPFLEGAFNLANLDSKNFKVLKKEGLVRFFNEYAQSDDWGQDRAGFIDIKDRFYPLLQQHAADEIFLISKEWFRKNDRVLSEDSDVYTYYFLIVWMDTDDKVVNVCEWSYD